MAVYRPEVVTSPKSPQYVKVVRASNASFYDIMRIYRQPKAIVYRLCHNLYVHGIYFWFSAGHSHCTNCFRLILQKLNYFRLSANNTNVTIEKTADDNL